VAVALASGDVVGETEGVEALGIEDVVTPHPVIAGVGVSDRVVADVPDVKLAVGIGRVFEAIEARSIRAGLGAEGPVIEPAALPPGFNVLEGITLGSPSVRAFASGSYASSVPV
jgi:hypothetical protein